MRFFLAAFIFALSTASAGHACQPDPPPLMPAPEVGESGEAYTARVEALRAAEQAARDQGWVNQQQAWWDEAETVFVARVERTTTVRLDFGRAPRTYLRPVRWLKGEGPLRRFFVNHQGWTSCGPYGGGDAVGAEVGDTFLVFVRQGRPSLLNIITTLSTNAVTHPDLRARVASE